MRNRIYYLVSIVVFIGVFACEEKAFEVPKESTITIPEGTIVSIASVKAGLNRLEEKPITFTQDQFMEGYVNSSDKGGNFFKELILQDAPENPTAGIQLLVDERALFQRFPIGSKVRVQLNGLSVGFKNGVTAMGTLAENDIIPMASFLIDTHIFRTKEAAELVPLPISLTTLTREKELLYVNLNNMQFPANFIESIPKTLAAENSDSFDGLRPMINCESNTELILCTSTFASFKNFTIPATTGKVTGILSRDFGDDFFVLKMNSATDLEFKETQRCDPVFFECNNHDFKAAELLFEEDFETITNEAKLDDLGWINVNVTGDEKRWADKKIINVANRVLTLSAFNTNLRPLEAWLITPEIDMTGITDVFIQFRVRTRFNNGKTLQVWVTNNYSGDPLTTDWELLSANIPRTTFNYVTIKQDISCLTGNLRVAFQYKGYDPVATSTYEIDDVRFYGNSQKEISLK